MAPAPAIPYDGNASAHRFDIGELNWGQHHYDLVQWAADADATGPVDLFMDQGGDLLSLCQRRDGLRPQVPGARPSAWMGGATFVGTAGRLTVDRSKLVSYPAELTREPINPGEVHVLPQ